jgi:hypothetical protein
MSQPLPGAFTVSPEGLTALANELATLAAELAGDVERMRSAAASFPHALDGHAGWAAGATGTAWASLCDLVADQTGALGGTLTAAVDAYAAEDAALAESVGPGRRAR